MSVMLFVGVERISRCCKKYLDYSAVAIESFGYFFIPKKFTKKVQYKMKGFRIHILVLHQSISALISDFNWNACSIHDTYCEYCFNHTGYV